ncbi:MAG TPA: HAMP domain-containing sensor histidine kinase [Clostridia bacterium]|nr:HAMP domain-containing sensor histidine kinase [Clostridia bacterium]
MYSTFLTNNINDHNQLIDVQSNIIANQADSFINAIDKNQYASDYVHSLITKYSINIDSRILILNTEGNVLLDTSNKSVNDDLSLIPEVKSALNGQEKTGNYRYKHRRLSYKTTPIIKESKIQGIVFIISDIGYIYADTSERMQGIIFISFIALLITIIVSIIFSNTISSPIVELNDLVQSVSGIVDKSNFSNDTLDEIEQLNSSFTILSTKFKQIENRRKKFVSNVSHELRTPITSMTILSETIMSQNTWDEALYREFMQDINTELQRLSHVIEDLLYLVDIEKDEVKFNYELTSINFMIRDVLSTLKPIADRKELILNFEESEKVQTTIDRSKFQRALINLIGNSIKYTESGQITIRLFILEEMINIDIEDTGVGISKEDLPYIFDRFYRVDESRATKKGSTGLGLSIAQEIIELHNGTIEIDSELDVGTSVKIKIPNKKV